MSFSRKTLLLVAYGVSAITILIAVLGAIIAMVALVKGRSPLINGIALGCFSGALVASLAVVWASHKRPWKSGIKSQARLLLLAGCSYLFVFYLGIFVYLGILSFLGG